MGKIKKTLSLKQKYEISQLKGKTTGVSKKTAFLKKMYIVMKSNFCNS